MQLLAVLQWGRRVGVVKDKAPIGVGALPIPECVVFIPLRPALVPSLTAGAPESTGPVSLPARCSAAEARLQARLQAMFEAAHGGAAPVSNDPNSVNGLRALAQLLLHAKSPLYSVDVALDIFAHRTCVITPS